MAVQHPEDPKNIEMLEPLIFLEGYENIDEDPTGLNLAILLNLNARLIIICLTASSRFIRKN